MNQIYNVEQVSVCCLPFGCVKENCLNTICKKKFDGRKTSLSNILLTIIMEEEKTERDKRVAKLMKIKTDNKFEEKCQQKQNVHEEHVNIGTIVDIENQHFHLSSVSSDPNLSVNI